MYLFASSQILKYQKIMKLKNTMLSHTYYYKFVVLPIVKGGARQVPTLSILVIRHDRLVDDQIFKIFGLNQFV